VPSRTARRAPGRSVRLVAVLSALGAVGLSLASGWGGVGWWGVLLLAAAVAASETAVVRLRWGRQRWTLSLTEAALGAALVLATGAWVVLAVGLGVTVAQRLRRQPRITREYNVAQLVSAAAVGQAVAGVTGGGIAGACLGMTAFWLVNYVLVAVAVSLTSQRPLRSLLTSSAGLSALHTAGSSSVGLLAAYLSLHAPLGLLGLVVPLTLLWSSYDQQTRRGAEVRLFAELARGRERQTAPSGEASAELVVTAAARLLGGADVELVLLAPDGAVRYLGDETGVPDRLRVGSDVFDEPWVLEAMGERGVTLGRAGGRPYVSAVLGSPDAPLALLRAQRGPEAASFDRDELRLAQVLVGQAESWLSVAALAARHQEATQRGERADEAARALGDLGSATAPSLVVLRESADRLARLAASDGAVDDIVEELHLVERAVASLLGAVALAAEPDLLRTSLPSSATREESAWTTTGVLP
jgi:hypothetical protein